MTLYVVEVDVSAGMDAGMDELVRAVVSARSPEAALLCLVEKHWVTGGALWRYTVRELTEDEPEGVVCADVNYG